MSSAPDRTLGHLPGYLLEAAEAAGRPLAPTGWRLAPPRGYRSQKVIFFVRSLAGAPVVVKLTQDARFNELLLNEASALEALAAVPLSDTLGVPRLWFRSAHAGLAIVAEDAVAGHALVRQAGSGREPGFPQVVEVMTDALTALAIRTTTAQDDTADALLDILDRYRFLYRPSVAHVRRLEACAGALGELGAKLPLVFTHGDATVYNTLVAGEQPHVTLVDWENADSVGPPLWDLLHFLHSHAALSAERAGRRYTPRRFTHEFLDPGGSESRRAVAIRPYCEQVGVPDEAIEPLLLSWLARHAVREARQLEPGRLQGGGFHRLLACALDRGVAG